MSWRLRIHIDRGGDRPLCGTGHRTTTNLALADCPRCIRLSLTGRAA